MDNKDAKFAQLMEHYPFEASDLRPETWTYCLHCGHTFRLIAAKLDADGLVVCAHAPDCDGSALDFWPWSAADWTRQMGGQLRPGHWPEEPELDTLYELYEEVGEPGAFS